VTLLLIEKGYTRLSAWRQLGKRPPIHGRPDFAVELPFECSFFFVI